MALESTEVGSSSNAELQQPNFTKAIEESRALIAHLNLLAELAGHRAVKRELEKRGE